MMKRKVSVGLKTENLRIPEFYLLPKIHKKRNPGCPAVTYVNCNTSNISKYADYHLQPIFKEIPLYVKNKRFYSKI